MSSHRRVPFLLPMMLSQVAVKLSPVQAVQGSGSSPLADRNALIKIKGTSVSWEEAQEPPEEHEMAASVAAFWDLVKL